MDVPLSLEGILGGQLLYIIFLLFYVHTTVWERLHYVLTKSLHAYFKIYFELSIGNLTCLLCHQINPSHLNLLHALLHSFSEQSALELFALKAAMLMPNLLLPKPHNEFNSDSSSPLLPSETT